MSPMSPMYDPFTVNLVQSAFQIAVARDVVSANQSKLSSSEVISKLQSLYTEEITEPIDLADRLIAE